MRDIDHKDDHIDNIIRTVRNIEFEQFTDQGQGFFHFIGVDEFYYEELVDLVESYAI